MRTASKLNFAAGGIHEIAALVDCVLLAGHYDDPDLADAAIARLNHYSAVWSTVNRVATLPDGHSLNPSQLTRGSRVGSRHMDAIRTSGLLDFDPGPRPINTMSTAAELESAFTQAVDCRTWLRSLGWPLLPLCLSGSGYHLRPRIELPSDAENNQLMRRLLLALRHRYSFVDVGMFDSPRLARYYGTWNRKSAENTAERPWRQSAVIEVGEDVIVTRAQIETVITKIGLPTISKYSGPEKSDPVAVDRTIHQLADWLDRLGVELTDIDDLPDGRKILRLDRCPLFPAHRGSSTGIGVSVSGRPLRMCAHTSCGMPFSQWRELVEKKHGCKLQLGGSCRRLIFGNGAK